MKKHKQRRTRKVDPLGEAVSFVRKSSTIRPKLGIILGSGLGDFGEEIKGGVAIDTSSIPHYPRSTVEGHRGKLIIGKLGRNPVCVLQGRVHLYETGSIEPTLFPIRVLHGIGIRTLVMTNAAGAINGLFSPGDLMLITDQINLTFEQPLAGVGRGARHKPVFDGKSCEVVLKCAKDLGIALQQGVYCGLKGPSYETAAEIEMLRRLGADAVGMSTVNEASLAAALGMKLVGLSCITNLATGVGPTKLSHQEVTDVASRVRTSVGKLLRGLVLSLP